MDYDCSMTMPETPPMPEHEGLPPQPYSAPEQESEAEPAPTLTPKQSYGRMLERYTSQTRTIRHLQASHRPEQADKLDYDRHKLHERILGIAADLGKDKDQVFLDMLLAEGNLEELGVRGLPMIQLPMVRASFTASPMDRETSVTSNKYIPAKLYPSPALGSHMAEKPSQSLKTPDGQVVASMQRPRIMDVHEGLTKDEITFDGNPEEFEKWNGTPYFALIYASSQYTNYLFAERQFCEEYTSRIQRMRQLAEDLNLNLFETNDGMGHQDYGSLVLSGVEVPAERVTEVAQAIRNNPGKYWLTDDELDNPTSLENLLKQDLEVVADGFTVLDIKLRRIEAEDGQVDPKIQTAYDTFAEALQQKRST
jgi:hypothetical protein